jgi:predicted porin
VGIGAAATGQDHSKNADYTRFGPRIHPQRDAAGNWQVGGTLGYSGFEVGANLGDHYAPGCEPGSNCKTNDFWDVGVALRVGSGAISAAYMASLPRQPGPDDVGRIDVFSLNAGYRVSPGFDIYGGVDWVDLNNTSDTGDQPVDTRFMLGTNLRF